MVSALRNGISFSPAGLLTPYHIGVSSVLLQEGIITPSTVLAGASGGALAAVCASLSNHLPSETVLESCCLVAQRCRDAGQTFRTLRLALDEVLQDTLPPESASLIQSRNGKVIIAYQEIYPKYQKHYQTTYTDKDDLINALRASCCIPFYFSGNLAIKVSSRDSYAIDGFFSVQRARFGCPPTAMERQGGEVIVTPFDPELVGLNPYDVSVYPARDDDDDDGDSNGGVIDIISPRLLMDQGKREAWDYDLQKLFSLALQPPQGLEGEFLDNSGIEAVYRKLYNAGVESAGVYVSRR